MTKRLIVNADDYGHSAGTSQGIRQAHLQGIVTSTTVMINYPASELHLREAKQACPRLGLGLHLVLTSGSPVLAPEEVPGLVTNSGRFYDLPGFMQHRDQLQLDEVELEWRAQIAAFTDAIDCRPDHLDSHHHISYASPDLFNLMVKLAGELDCPIRIPFGISGTLFENKKSCDDFVFPSAWFHDNAQSFFGNFYDRSATFNILCDILHQVRDDQEHDTFELMCHPAITDNELIRTSAYHAKRAVELALLTSAEIKELVAELGIDLISFDRL